MNSSMGGVVAGDVVSYYIIAQDLDGTFDSGLSGSGQSVGVSATNEHGASAQAKRFDDVAAATNTAIHQDLNLAAHSGHDFWKSFDRRRDAVQLASTVI